MFEGSLHGQKRESPHLVLGNSVTVVPQEKVMIMKNVTAKNLAQAIYTIQSLSIKEKELICDEIYKEQPNLLASILVQQQLGNSLQDVDVLLHILMVLHLYLKVTGIAIPKITEQEQEYQLGLLKSTILFSDGLEDRLVNESVNQYISNHNEPILVAYAVETMRNAGFFEKREENTKHLMIAGLNLVACIENVMQKSAQHRPCN